MCSAREVHLPSAARGVLWLERCAPQNLSLLRSQYATRAPHSSLASAGLLRLTLSPARTADERIQSGAPSAAHPQLLPVLLVLLWVQIPTLTFVSEATQLRASGPLKLSQSQRSTARPPKKCTQN